MTEIKTNAIPHRLKNVNKEHPYVSGASPGYMQIADAVYRNIVANYCQ